VLGKHLDPTRLAPPAKAGKTVGARRRPAARGGHL